MGDQVGEIPDETDRCVCGGGGEVPHSPAVPDIPQVLQVFQVPQVPRAIFLNAKLGLCDIAHVICSRVCNGMVSPQ